MKYVSDNNLQRFWTKVKSYLQSKWGTGTDTALSATSNNPIANSAITRMCGGGGLNVFTFIPDTSSWFDSDGSINISRLVTKAGYPFKSVVSVTLGDNAFPSGIRYWHFHTEKLWLCNADGSPHGAGAYRIWVTTSATINGYLTP